MRFPIHITKPKWSNINYHGPDRQPITEGFGVVRLSCRVPAWRFIRYGRDGQWWHFDLFLRGFR